MRDRLKMVPFGDSGLNIEVGSDIAEATSLEVRALMLALKAPALPGIVDAIPTFRSLYLQYDPLRIDLNSLMTAVRVRADGVGGRHAPTGRLLEIPVVYGAEHQCELEVVARILEKTPEEIIANHAAPVYLVHMNGSAGGAAFIKMEGALAKLPRKKTPSVHTPAGTLLIAGGVGTAFKSLPGPTGWYAIGKCPLKQWLPRSNPPLLVLAGDYIRYRQIEKGEFMRITREVEAGSYVPQWKPYQRPDAG